MMPIRQYLHVLPVVIVILCLTIFLGVPEKASATVTIGNCTIVTTTVAGSTRVTGTRGTNCTYADFSQYIDTACLQNPSDTTCSADELAAVQQIGLACAYNTSFACPSDITQQQKDALTKRVVSGCFSSLIDSPWTCVWNNLVASIAAVLISAAAWFLAVAGYLFNWLLDHTVVLFASSIYGPAASAIETAWTAFRDIANIVIIGIFTYIAIATILGNTDFGAKKMMARVLLVAVFINFSLLLTKMVVDASNFVSLQMYTASTGRSMSDAQSANNAPGGSLVSGVNPTGDYANSGIAGAFVSMMGVQNIRQTQTALTNLANEKNSAGIAFIHGLFTTILFLGAAVVLFYGSFLLISRALLLLFLLATSSIAVASYLIPKWEKSRFGWDAWTSALIWCSTLGPIMLFFLWMTLNVGNALKATSGTLGALVTNPAQGTTIGALFSYAIILGLLFMSFKISSMWANKVAGFNIAAGFAALPVTLASRLAGFAGRQTLGRFSTRRALRLGDEVDEAKLTAAATGNYRPLERLMRQKAKAESRAKSSYNLMNTDTAKAVAAGLHLPSLVSGADKKAAGFMDSAKSQAETAAKEAAGLALSQGEKAKIHTDAADAKTERRRERREDITRQREQHEETLETMEASVRSQTEPLKNQREGAQIQAEALKKAINKQYDRMEQGIAQEIARATPGSDAHKDAERRFADARAARKSALDEQDNKIKSVDEQIKAIETKAGIPEIREKIASLDATFKTENLSKEADAAEARKAGELALEKATVKNQEMAMAVGADRAVGRYTSTIMRSMGIDPAKSTSAGKMAFGQVKKKLRLKKELEMRKAEKEEAESAEPSSDSSGEKAAH
jgi:hypothetical protein